jgi:hypothetical protein
VASGSSAKKVARLAQKGKGKKVRFQDGTLFPTVMAVVVILGFGLISYARQAPVATDTPPTISDRWHIPIGFYHCDSFLQDLQGDKQGGDVADPNFTKYGLFSRDDGVIRWYPQLAASGKKAKLGAYLETYGVTVDSKGITFPADQNKGIVWEKASDSTVSKRYITDFKNIRIDRDEMAITIAFVPTGADIPMPDSAEKLAEIVAAEYGAAPTTTVKCATTTSVAAPTTTGG